MPLVRGITGLGKASNATQIILSITGAFTSGQMCILGLAFADPNIGVASISDDTTGPDMQFTRLALVPTVGVGDQRFELWATSPTGTNNGGSFVVINLTAAVYAAATMECWSGVGAIGAVGTANGFTANPSLSIVMGAGDHQIVSSFLTLGPTIPTTLIGTISRTIFSGP